jgi:hypothetical protein
MHVSKHLGTAASRMRAWRRLRIRTRGFMTNRRGSALILTLILTLSLASLATSAIYLGGNAQILATSYDKERDLRYAAEAMLAMGKSTLNYDPLAVPDSGYTTVVSNSDIKGADGVPVPDVTASMYIGPTSSKTGQFGRFVSVVAVAKNKSGATVVRRLELAQESFAKFAYWSNSESNNGDVIYFGGNDQIFGPVWSNDVIHMYYTGARFHDEVGTAKYIENAGYGTFDKGYTERQKKITLPSNTDLAKLKGYATPANFAFTAPNASSTSNAMMRIEFVTVDNLNGDSVPDADEGFFRVYRAKGSGTAAWVRGDWSNRDDNCGASYYFWNDAKGKPVPMFVPVSEHIKTWFKQALQDSPYGYTKSFRTSVTGTSITSTLEETILGQASARCYPGGDPHLLAVNIRGTTAYNNAATLKNPTNSIAAAHMLAGDSTTFTASGPLGAWDVWPGTVDPRVTATRTDASYLFPLHRSLNPGTKGVIYVNGTTALSGQLQGRVTIYATGNVAVIDDLTYAVDPSNKRCVDILGIISGNNIFVADNAIEGPQDIAKYGSDYRNFSATKDVYLQGVMLAINTSFGAENYASGPQDANGCEGQKVGRGCLYLTGGIIQQARGPVGTFTGSGATGYTKRYSYDRCALYNPPPYFPTTGRYTDNRYYEYDPDNFDVAKLYADLTPGP